jgi:hypothetical protein
MTRGACGGDEDVCELEVSIDVMCCDSIGFKARKRWGWVLTLILFEC